MNAGSLVSVATGGSCYEPVGIRDRPFNQKNHGLTASVSSADVCVVTKVTVVFKGTWDVEILTLSGAKGWIFMHLLEEIQCKP